MIQELSDPIFSDQEVNVDVLRLDEIHPIVSGNKIFKLHYFLKEAEERNCKTVITFGGAYSNHLVACAFAFKEAGIKSIGIVRGERPAVLSRTLLHCLEYGMELIFISREDYKKREELSFLNVLKDQHPDHMLIPEGGYHPLGAKGAALIGDYFKEKNYSHIGCSVGTATTIAGLLQTINSNQIVMGFAALKGMTDIKSRLKFLINGNYKKENFMFIDDYTFNGYAKKDSALLEFMNMLYETQKLPTDFVYTGKMLYGIYDMVKSGKFASGSKVLCIHTGGLQGNVGEKFIF